MRTLLTVNTSYNSWTIVAIHHDQDRSVMLGERVIKVAVGQYRTTYVTGVISDQSYTCREWYNGYYTDDHRRACETYLMYVKARMT